MRTQIFARLALAIGASFLGAREVAAGPAESLLGVGARTIALGGAGTALVRDATAVHYNPARLGACDDGAVTVGFQYVSYGLRVKDGGMPSARPDALKNTARPFIGACLQLPFGLAVGGLLSFGLKDPFSFQQETPNDRPRFVLHGQPLEAISVSGGAALRPVPELSFGAAVTLAIDASFLLDANIPLLGTGVGEADIRARIGFSCGLLFGASWVVREAVEVAVVLRTATAARFQGRAPIRANIAGIEAALPITMTFTDGFTPLQIGFGVNVRPLDDLRLVADLTWHQWSKFVQPFLDVRGEGDSALARELQFSALEPANFRNIVVPRLGAEWAFLEEALLLRAGYSFRPTPAPLPTGRANLLDAATHLVSAGAGYAFEGHADAETGAVEFAKSIDAFVRLSAMHPGSYEETSEVGSRPVKFGGTNVEFGASFSVGWR